MSIALAIWREMNELGIPQWLKEPAIRLDPEDVEPLDKCALVPAQIKKVLLELGIACLFPVQTMVLKCLEEKPYADFCVSAATGSGKTLAYILPIVASVSQYKVRRLRALVVVPGRELALQVYRSFEPFAQELGLNIGIAIGQGSLVAEQRQLTGDLENDLAGGASLVDILIATPGRLVDHLQRTKNFTLQHVEWLVIDEADRLLDQSFNEWLPNTLAALDPHKVDSPKPHPIIPDTLSFRSTNHSFFQTRLWLTPLRKLLFSATPTKNPAKIATLNLHQPIYLAVGKSSKLENDNGAGSLRKDDSYAVPTQLTEKMLICEEEKKPMMILYLLRMNSLTRSLCFTKSIDATERLLVLLQHACPEKSIMVFSSQLLGKTREGVLSQFNKGEIDLLICSDAAARGLDLENIQSVINYDAPVHARTYIHRVGRTARAGRTGTAYTIVAEKEAHHFKALMRLINRDSPVKKIKPSACECNELVPLYEQALDHLRRVYTGDSSTKYNG